MRKISLSILFLFTPIFAIGAYVKGPTKVLESAKVFDGTEKILATSKKGKLSKSFTVEVWVYPKSLEHKYIGILSHRTEERPTDFRLFIDKKDIVFGYFSKETNQWKRKQLRNVLTLDTWTHISITVKEDKEMSFFVNSFEYKMGKIEEPINIDSKEWTVGCHVAKEKCLNGYLDEIRIWNYDKSQKELASTFRNATFQDSEELLLRVDFLQENLSPIPILSRNDKLEKKVVQYEKLQPKIQLVKKKDVQKNKEIITPIQIRKQTTLEYPYSILIGTNIEFSQFKNSVSNGKGKYSKATAKVSSQTNKSQSINMRLIKEINKIVYYGEIEIGRWSNGSSTYLGVGTKRNLTTLELFNHNSTLFTSVGAGVFSGKINGFTQSSSATLKGEIRVNNSYNEDYMFNLSFGYKLIDLDFKKSITDSDGDINYISNYKGGIFLGVSLEKGF